MSLNNLIGFCEKYQYIICYGAGDYSRYVRCFLQCNHIKIKAFLVSVKDGNQRAINDVPVYSIDELPISLDMCGVIVATDEKYHAEIKKNLVYFSEKRDGIYTINKDEISEISEINEIEPMLQTELLIDLINVHGNIKNDKILLYEERIEEIKKNYEKIKLSYMDMRQIGAINSWIYYCYQRKLNDNKIYNLFYPKVHEHLKRQGWDGPNAYLSSKLSSEGIEMVSKKNVDFWKYCLKKYRQLFIVDSNFIIYEYVQKFNILSVANLFPQDEKYINFTDEEIFNGDSRLKEIGVRERFVCISSRDSGYRKNVIKTLGSNEEIFDKYRNSDVQFFCNATEYLYKNGINSVRMGALVEREFRGKGVIDYAYKYRSEFMDVYLFSKCEFFVSDSSGIQMLALLFSKPLVTINAPILSMRNEICLNLSPTKDLVIFKKYWDTKRKKYLTLKEILDIEINGFEKQYNSCGPQNTYLIYHEQGIEPINNTAEEIYEVTREMLERINGTWVYDEEDLVLQTKYRDIIDNFPKKNSFVHNWRVGAEFLKKNRYLLD